MSQAVSLSSRRMICWKRAAKKFFAQAIKTVQLKEILISSGNVLRGLSNSRLLATIDFQTTQVTMRLRVNVLNVS